MKPFSKQAIIIGAGPAGLTAAYELLRNSDIKPIVVDSSETIGGLSATYRYKGNFIDVGGHRFFSDNQDIISWWKNILPFEKEFSPGYMQDKCNYPAIDPETTEKVMLVRNRLSRIYFRRRFFPYPMELSFDTLKNLGLFLSTHIICDYFFSIINKRPEKNLEDFLINRFGKRLYEIFFKNYTEKIWGVSCKKIDAKWGRQRIRGISVSEIIRHALFQRKEKSTEKSFISRFLYPKYGVGQMWEEVAQRIIDEGGEIYSGTKVRELHVENMSIKKVAAESKGHIREFVPDYVFSSAPLIDLVVMLRPSPPMEIKSITDNLEYRDFIIAGILAKTMREGSGNPFFPEIRLLPDTWLYIQEPDLTTGRIQIYNNWSPYMVGSKNRVWLGVEFFCSHNDEIWSKSDAELVELASKELDILNLVNYSDILDGVCIRTRKAYPSYCGAYNRLHAVKKYLCSFNNLFCIGRNGLHQYNNMDHSMLTAILSVKALTSGNKPPESVWEMEPEDIR